jgi:transcriptional antiterminator NusG
MAAKWYAIQTHAGSEQSVKRAIETMAEQLGLQDKIEEIVVPTEDVIEVKNGKKKITERSLYPGYVFAKMDLDTDLWHKIQSLPKVSRFIGESKKPTPLNEKDIKNILDKVENRAAPKPKISFEPGEMVRIVEGPFANFTGMVEEYDLEHGKLKLNVSIFGRSTPVEILYSQVEKII